MLNTTSAVYGDYLKAGNAYWTGPILVFCMLAMQSSSIMNSYTLVWWQAKYVAAVSFLTCAYASSTAHGTGPTGSTRLCMVVWVSDSPCSRLECKCQEL